jgi:hypothetical protein
MNALVNLTPPNLDIVCSVSGSSTTCSNPLMYYVGYSFDILLILFTAWLVFEAINYS